MSNSACSMAFVNAVEADGFQGLAPEVLPWPMVAFMLPVHPWGQSIHAKHPRPKSHRTFLL